MNRILAFVIAVMGFSVACGEDPVTLAEKMKVGEQMHHTLDLSVSGKMLADKGEQPLVGRAILKYPQRILEVGKDGLATKVLRFYGGARARFQVAGENVERNLRQSSRMMVGEHSPKGFSLWALSGPITADERELVEDVLDTTRIPGLLPKEPVRVGDGWTVDASVTKGLCNLETMSVGELVAKLQSIKDDKATISLKGSLEGMQQGGNAKLEVEATATYDMKGNFVQKLEWNERDARSSSPIAPTGTYTVKIVVDRDKSQAPNLTDEAVEGVDLSPKEDSKLLLFEAPGKQYKFLHDRSWFVTALRNNIVVMRCVKDNEFLGQLSVAMLNDKAPGTKFKADDFQRVVEQTNGIEIEEIERSDDMKSPYGVSLHRLIAKGTAGGGKLKLLHRHYLGTADNGLQIMLSFLLEPQHSDKFANSDDKIIGSLEIPATKAASGTSEPKR